MEVEPKPRPFLENEPYRKGELPAPSLIVERALAYLQDDGSVLEFDDERNEWFTIPPYDPVPLDDLPDDVYASKLRRLADAIAGTVTDIADDLSQEGFGRTPKELVAADEKRLAHYLSAYRYNRAFIDYAASLTSVEGKNSLHFQQLPHDPAWSWVPQLRATLAAKNQQLTTSNMLERPTPHTGQHRP
jgi:hypothetical protein